MFPYVTPATNSYTYKSAEEIRGDMTEAIKTAEAATMRSAATTVRTDTHTNGVASSVPRCPVPRCPVPRPAPLPEASTCPTLHLHRPLLCHGRRQGPHWMRLTWTTWMRMRRTQPRVRVHCRASVAAPTTGHAGNVCSVKCAHDASACHIVRSRAGDSAVAHRTGKVSLESRLAEKREKAATHQRKRDVVYSALGRVFGSLW
jgi:hypothetical protein